MRETTKSANDYYDAHGYPSDNHENKQSQQDKTVYSEQAKWAFNSHWGVCLRPHCMWELPAPPDPVAVFKEPTSKAARTGERRKGREDKKFET